MAGGLCCTPEIAMTKVFDISLEMMRLVTDVLHGQATEGGTYYLKDIRGMKVQPNAYYDDGTLWIRSGTHANKALPVLAHVDQSVRFDPLSSALCANQVETLTVVGTVTGDGNATVIVTAAGMPNSPKTVSVAVTNGNSASVVAGKVRTALSIDADVKGFFTVGGSGADVVLTAKIAKANDATMNVSIANGTCTGLTTVATSADTTAGAVGPRYSLTKGVFPWEQIKGAIQTALDMTYVIDIDSSLVGDGETLEFALPAGVTDVRDVYLERGSEGYQSISNHWDLVNGQLAFEHGFAPYDNDIIHLHHKGRHAEIVDYDTEINMQINTHWLVLAAAKELLMWAREVYAPKRAEMQIDDRINNILNMMKGKRPRLGSPDVRMKSAGGGRDYSSISR
jgi:hypothetical protein